MSPAPLTHMRVPEGEPIHEYLLDVIKLFGKDLRTCVVPYVDMLLSLPEKHPQ